jgi:hypothetical protein
MVLWCDENRKPIDLLRSKSALGMMEMSVSVRTGLLAGRLVDVLIYLGTQKSIEASKRQHVASGRGCPVGGNWRPCHQPAMVLLESGAVQALKECRVRLLCVTIRWSWQLLPNG